MAGTSSKQHTRSLSHPFPNFFGRRRSWRADGTNSGQLKLDSAKRVDARPSPTRVSPNPFDSSDDDDVYRFFQRSPTKFNRDPTTGSQSGHTRKSRPPESQVGNCMTCNNQVKWPANVTVFRCSDCLTINDTVPHEPTRNPDSRESKQVEQPRVLPLSVEKTREIIYNCIMSYLRSRSNASSVSPQIRLSTPDAAGPSVDVDNGGVSLENHTPIPIITTSQNVAPESFSSRNPFRRKPVPQACSPTPQLDQSLPLPSRNPFKMAGRVPPPLSLGSGHVLQPPTPCLSPRNFAHPPRSASFSHSPSAFTPKLSPSTQSPVKPDRLGTRGLKEWHHETRSSSDVSRPHRQAPTPPEPVVGKKAPTKIFGPLEEYIADHYGKWLSLNASFHSARSRLPAAGPTEGPSPLLRKRPANSPTSMPPPPLYRASSLDPGASMTGGPSELNKLGSEQETRPTVSAPDTDLAPRWLTNSKSPMINWAEMMAWYDVILTAGRDWREVAKLNMSQASLIGPPGADIPNVTAEIDREIQHARWHVRQTLLRVTESILRRPGRPLQEPSQIRFLLIILSNPLLHASMARRYADTPAFSPGTAANSNRPRAGSNRPARADSTQSVGTSDNPQKPSPGPGLHHGLVKRVVGILANLPAHCHRVLVTWMSRYPEEWFKNNADLVLSFVTHRLARQDSRKPKASVLADPTIGLIPQLHTSSGPASTVQLHAALGMSNAAGTGLSSHIAGRPSLDRRRTEDAALKLHPPAYSDDWQLRAAGRAMAILFAANNIFHSRRRDRIGQALSDIDAGPSIRAPGQLLPTSYFYIPLLDYTGAAVADFESWESRRHSPTVFSFCQFPFFLSIGTKIRILQHDAKRQMENKAREAFFDSLLHRRNAQQYFTMRVRRDCLAEDSLARVSETVASGSGLDEVKKGLKVQFVGEDGIDAGGLRKEWFLLLVRELFDPSNGMFLYDEDSRYCYFNPFTFERTEQFFLVGAVLGLAIYNTTILDVPLPPFAFRKLLASASPASALQSDKFTSKGLAHGGISQAQTPFVPTLDDLAQLHPAIANSLRQVLDFEPEGGYQPGDPDPVAETFGLTFSVSMDRYGSAHTVDLCRNGGSIDVTLTNRHHFVNLYIRHLLVDSVGRQFEPFRRGFWSVCSGNAIELFRPEEVELLVRGADEPLQVEALKAVASHEGFTDPVSGEPVRSEDAVDKVPVLQWFWEMVGRMTDGDRRRLIGWVTGSDRIPADGASSLVIRVACAGEVGPADRWGRSVVRLPVARTCFNMVQLPLYRSRRELEEKVWCAVTESGGFGLK